MHLCIIWYTHYIDIDLVTVHHTAHIGYIGHMKQYYIILYFISQGTSVIT